MKKIEKITVANTRLSNKSASVTGTLFCFAAWILLLYIHVEEKGIFFDETFEKLMLPSTSKGNSNAYQIEMIMKSFLF